MQTAAHPSWGRRTWPVALVGWVGVLALLGQPLPAVKSYGRRPSNTPDPQIERLLLGGIR